MKSTTIVSESNTALAMGSGSLPVFATPAMIALMEEAACLEIAPHLGEGETSVGTLMNVSHLSATPVGMMVTAEAVLTEKDGRRFVFEVTASDERGIIGKGTHERFAVNADKFVKKTYSK